jgi:hypothetical protein
MTTFTFRPVAIGLLTLLIFAGTAAAQAPILNALEVQKLVASNAPGDNAALAAHFAALADRYDADAKRHTAMAGAFIAAPTRRVAANSAAEHCKRLAQLSTDSAQTLRELAAHHKQLAGGAVSAAPKDGARFQRGAGAPEPTDAALQALAAKADAPSDHRALADYFVTAARRYTEDANGHAAMAGAYRGTRNALAADHCDRLVALGRDQAKEASAAAEMHKHSASVAR